MITEYCKMFAKFSQRTTDRLVKKYLLTKRKNNERANKDFHIESSLTSVFIEI